MSPSNVVGVTVGVVEASDDVVAVTYSVVDGMVMMDVGDTDISIVVVVVLTTLIEDELAATTIP